MTCTFLVGDTGFEPVTSSVSRIPGTWPTCLNLLRTVANRSPVTRLVLWWFVAVVTQLVTQQWLPAPRIAAWRAGCLRVAEQSQAARVSPCIRPIYGSRAEVLDAGGGPPLAFQCMGCE
jgi:hypothetical protein